jgi:uncharacterized protein YjiS (DUF1127 family)
MATTECTEIQPTSMAHTLGQLFQAGAARVAGAWRAARNRRSINQLASWDARMLSDIGLTSSDVQSALASRFAEDPSNRLQAFSSERKQADYARRVERHSEWTVDI